MDYITNNICNTERIIETAKSKKKKRRLLDRRYLPQIDLFLKYVKKEAIVLDVGVRDGLFLEELSKFGYYNLFGADISKHSIELCEDRGFSCFLMNIQTDKVDMLFDAIILSHVLEHCPDPDSVIKNVEHHLCENGIFLVEVPQEKKEEHEYKNKGHFSYFKELFELKSLFLDGKWILLEEFKIETSNERSNFRLILRKKPND